MALSLLSNLLSAVTGSSSSSHSITDETTKKACWKTLKILKVETSLGSTVTTNPIFVDQGADDKTVQALIKTDLKTLKIVSPTSIRIVGKVDNKSLIGELAASFHNTAQTFKIVVKDIMASNMAMMSLEIEQTPESTSSFAVIIELERAVAPSVKSAYSPAQPADAKETKTSIQTPEVAKVSVAALSNKIRVFSGN